MAMRAGDVTLLNVTLPGAALRALEAGAWRLAYAGGGVRHLQAGGVEVLRAVDFVARDAAWGAPAPVIEDESVETADGRLRIACAARIGTALRWRVEIVAQGDALSVSADGAALEDFDTARSGFVTLHPLAGFAGATVTAFGADGAERRATIPARVSPAHPTPTGAASR